MGFVVFADRVARVIMLHGMSCTSSVTLHN